MDLRNRFYSGLILIAVLSCAAAGQDLNFRIGARYGTYQKGFSLNSSTQLGTFRIYNATLFDIDRETTTSSGLALNLKQVSISVYAFTAGGRTQLNYSGGLQLGRTRIMASYRDFARSGNLNISHVFKNNVSVRATGTMTKNRPWSGHVEISFPVRISLGKKQAISEPSRVIETGKIEGQISLAFEGCLVKLQGPDSSSTLTDELGRFSFKAVLPGIYEIEVLNLPLKYTADVLQCELRVKEKKRVMITIKER